MAELYIKQGHQQRALAIYRKLLRQEPTNEELRRRIEALEGERMSFREHMQRIVESTPGAIACSVMGFDGIPVDSFQVGNAQLDIPSLLTEFSTAAVQLKSTAEHQPDVSGLQEMSLRAEKLAAVLHLLNDEYFMAVVLQPDALVGKARYLLRLLAPEIQKELA